MAYFLGKEMTGNMDDLFPDVGRNKADCLQRCKEQLALDPGFDYQGCIGRCAGMRVMPGQTTMAGEVTTPGTITGPVTEPVIAPGGKKIVERNGTVMPKEQYDIFGPETPTEPEADTDWIDNLMTGIFGKEFETLRGIGGRTRESVFDTLARQGLMGTGAAKGVAEDIAWQTERGISDVMRWGEMWKYQQEQDVMNQILQYFFGMGSMYR